MAGKGNPEFGKSIKPGRKKGVPNKTTQYLKEMMLAPFDARAFNAWAAKNPDTYYPMIAKLIPKEIVQDNKGTIEVVIKDVTGRRDKAD